jgi:hypothetical protein
MLPFQIRLTHSGDSLILFSLDVMRMFVVSLLAVVCIGCTTPRATSNDVFAFKTPQEEQQFKRRALGGDNKAAQRLVDYYFFVRYDPRSALYWARICASHGDANCAKSVKSLRQIIREQGI